MTSRRIMNERAEEIMDEMERGVEAQAQEHLPVPSYSRYFERPDFTVHRVKV